MSLKDSLLHLIKSHGFVSYGDMCQFTVEEGYKISTAERRLRGLCADYDEQKRKQTPEIKPIMKKSKRNTDYIAAWEVIKKEHVIIPIVERINAMQPYKTFEQIKGRLL